MTHIITSPGKFEGEPEYVPVFWDLAMSGQYDEIGDYGEVIFRLSDQDKEEWPELAGFGVLTMIEDGNGFVYSTVE